MSRMRIATVVPAEHRVVFTGQTWEVLAKGHRYLVDNVREALSEPGQWYLDRPLAQLTYISKPGEQPGQAVVIAPRLEQLLVLQGDLTKKRWVQHIQFSGLSFAHTNWTLPPAGQAFPQARASLADHGLANCVSGIHIRTYRFRGGQQRRRAPATLARRSSRSSRTATTCCDEWTTEPARQSPAPKARPDYSIVALINWRQSRLS